jgi:hypothetical protein
MLKYAPAPAAPQIIVALLFSSRARLDAAWLRTQLPNATTNAQNNARLGAGVVANALNRRRRFG